MTLKIQNLFGGIPSLLDGELFQTLVESGQVRVERIVSEGHVTPSGEWYDQTADEWVLLVTGGAVLRVENDAEPVIMKPGDYVLIPAGCRHRVEQTDSGQKTVWLAIHFGDVSSR
jgi:cupin 2 domain-containing protein